MTSAQLARRASAEQERLARAAASLAAAALNALDPDDIIGSWSATAPEVTRTVAAGQYRAATTGVEHTARQVRLQGRTFRPDGVPRPEALSGIASDGRPLQTLLSVPAVQAHVRIVDGAPAPETFTQARRQMTMLVGTQIADAARAAGSVATTSDRQVFGYLRQVQAGACSRCIILAGAWYGWNDGFERHPNCFPAGTVVSGPRHEAATRRWYEGELVVLRTAGGQELSATPNHPVLTDKGWVPAHLLDVGSRVIRSTAGEGALPLVVPDEQQSPSLIEDLWSADRMVPFRSVPTSTEDFHGDGGHGDVNVVLPDRLLRDGFHAPFLELLNQESFSGRVRRRGPFSALRSMHEFAVGVLVSAQRLVGSGSLLRTLTSSHLASPNRLGFRATSDRHSLVNEALANDVSGDSVPVGEGQLALAAKVGVGNGVFRQGPVSPRWDAPPGLFTVQSAEAYARRGNDLRDRLASQVETDRVVDLQRVKFAGHVYNLTSSEGWYSANGLIVSNCMCVHVPYTGDSGAGLAGFDPKAHFDGLPETEQDRIFGQAGAQAIRDGADPAQVVNARRGMRSTRMYGRQVSHTNEGRMRRHTSFTRAQRAAGATPGVRLMPEQIYHDAAGDRDLAIRLLKRNGYL